MSRYPIDTNDGWWFVWSLPVGVDFRSGEGLEKFDTYAEGSRECSRRNLAKVIAEGIADEPMADNKGQPVKLTYRDYYTATMGPA